MNRLVAALGLALTANTAAFDLDPACRQYYQMFQMPDLTYEDVGKIADRMHESNCWPAMQGLLPAAESSSRNATGLPSCEFLAQELVDSSDNVLKLFEVRPMIKSDCGEVDERCSDPEWSAATDHTYLESASYYNAKGRRFWMSQREKQCARGTTDRGSSLRYGDVYLRIPQCDLLIDSPRRLAEQLPKFGFRPVNCRGKIVYSDGNKSGFYLYMEQYSDGDNVVWGANIDAWNW